jgi:hypothetical protein
VDGNKSAAATFVPLRLLTLELSGSGGGTVTSTSEPGISCTTGSGNGCTHDFPQGAVVNLAAVADWKSLFGSWTGITSSSGATASVTMSAAKTVTATFSPAANARISLLDYPTLFDAYTSAPSGATILMKDIVFLENFMVAPINSATTYTLKGGYSDFTIPATGYSTIKGTLTIRNGRLIVDRVIVKP